MFLRRTVAILGTMALSVACAAAQDKSVPVKRVLVELFTSEGCSSCPPADTLLRELDGKRTKSGAVIVALSEHVTYWNSLGWSDPFSSETFTDRQAAYAERFRLDSSYTPQIVVNGTQQFVGSNGEAVMRAAEKDGVNATAAVRIDAAAVVGETVVVKFHASGDVPRDADLFAVLTDDADTSHVTRGENSGETLQHVSVARSWVRVAEVVSSGKGEVVLQIPQHGTLAGTQKRHVTLFLQSKGLGPVLAIDSKAL